MNKQKITLVGGGLVGSLLSLMLAKKGFNVTVFESRSDMRKVDISAGRSINLALANRGIRPLEQLGLMPDITKMLIPMTGRMVHVEGEPAQLQPYGNTSKDVIYSISRGQLNSYLMTKAEETGLVNFQFNCRVQNIDLATKSLNYMRESQSNHLARAEQCCTHTFDIVIGTDGANSPVRESILAATQGECDIDMLDHSYKELTILGNKEQQHKLEKNALHIWPRGEFMLIALPNLDGSFTVTLFMPNHGYTSFDSIDSDSEIDQFFDHHFPDVKPLLDELISSYQLNPTGKLATVKCQPWHYQDSALIIGDAAHAIVPFHGQGMNCGFEDCQQFSDLLDKALAGGQLDWQGLFKDIETSRKPNADAIANMALENYVEMRDSVRQHEFLLQKQFAQQIHQWFPDRFSPRYAMVMFEHRPYQEAYALGKKQQKLLTTLSDQYSCASQLTQTEVSQLLNEYGL